MVVAVVPAADKTITILWSTMPNELAHYNPLAIDEEVYIPVRSGPPPVPPSPKQVEEDTNWLVKQLNRMLSKKP